MIVIAKRWILRCVVYTMTRLYRFFETKFSGLVRDWLYSKRCPCMLFDLNRSFYDYYHQVNFTRSFSLLYLTTIVLYQHPRRNLLSQFQGQNTIRVHLQKCNSQSPSWAAWEDHSFSFSFCSLQIWATFMAPPSRTRNGSTA